MKPAITMRIGSLLTVTLLLSSCRPAASTPALTEDKLQSVYVALLEENERHKNLPPDSTSHFSADSVFHAFNTSEQDFRSTLEEYRANPRKWEKLLEGVIRQLEEKEKQRAEKPKG
jgi:hypothetical protein